MYGTITGNIIGTAYYLYFQAAGFLLVSLCFRRESLSRRLLIGSVTGSVMLTWLPLLFAFFFGFTPLSHILALLVTLPFLAVFLRNFLTKESARPQGKVSADSAPQNNSGRYTQQLAATIQKHALFGIAFLFLMAFWAYLLCTHTLQPGENGAFYTGQSTYGDMNMHLGFITSLARQGTFPPDYSIMPGVRLSYPFASDSISSSIYLMGASLRYAYMLPMFFAMAQIFVTVYLFARTVFSSQHGPSQENHPTQKQFLASLAHGRKLHESVALLTLLLFFCNGGLGFAYFLDWPQEQGLGFSDIFTGFYTTPTNLVAKNIRWVNIIADMLLPQRATLFGYALLFPMLWLLYQAAFRERKKYFPLAGLFVAALPMIHTHSFLSAGVVSAVWMLLWLHRKVWPLSSQVNDSSAPLNHTRAQHTIPICSADHNRNSRSSYFLHAGICIFLLFLLIMSLIQYGHNRGMLSSPALMFIALLPFASAVLMGLLLLLRFVRQSGWKELWSGWGLFLVCVLILALPQLLYWTFGQVTAGGFVRGYFNWGNQGDFYLWFYLKNIGLPLLLIIGAACACTRKTLPLLLPALFLWWLGELMVFTPNTYDNNKLLYVAYLLLCLAAADYGTELFQRIKKLGGARFLAAVFLFFSAFSGVLALGREAVSRYQLFNTTQVSLAEYVEENTAPDAVFLTGTRHNNEIAALTGRNIVCGADTFLYFHGLDTTERKSDLQLMYEAPAEHLDLFEKYNVSYVVVSSYERRSYDVDEVTFQKCFSEVFSFGDTVLYATSNYGNLTAHGSMIPEGDKTN